jgi:hypothetical protein
MAMKVLSGVLETRLCRTGQASIDLDTNRIATGPDGRPACPEGLSLARTRMIGSGRYRSPPCKIVALREIVMHVVHEGGPHVRDVIEGDSFRISDVSLDEHFMTINWESTGGSSIVEISYMVIGEVP